MSLSRLTLPALRQLSRQCGLATTGTKPTLIYNLTHLPSFTTLLSSPKSSSDKLKATKRICSIDMGIRNLAFCVLDADSDHTTSSSKLALRSWQRVEIAPRLSKDPAPETTSVKKEKEVFDPPTYAGLAHRFLSQTILPFAPDVVLIERQRYRSAGSPIIQEWTVRVNAFEAMLWATLHTFREEGRWVGLAETVSPARVAAFWGEDSIKDKPEGKTNVKKLKIAAAAEILRAGDLDASDVSELRELFLDKADGKRRMKKVDGVEKIDDLADCLLQGVAWQRWQDARYKLIRDGWEALVDRKGVN